MSKHHDRLSLLETFIRISDRGCISAAARDLGLSQASASRHLKELETHFGSQLVRRTTHSLSLTPAGQNMLEDARKIIGEWEALTERHSGVEKTAKGPLKVVAPVALGQSHLADIAFHFQQTNPLVTLDWVLDDDPIRFAEVGCDCWVKVGPIPDDRLVVRALGQVERLVVARPDVVEDLKAATPNEVAKVPFIALAPFEGATVRLTHKAGQVAKVEPAAPATTNNIFVVRSAVRSGHGAAILPRWFVEQDLLEGRLVDVLPDWRASELQINVAFLPAFHQPRRLAAFLENLADEVPKIPGVFLNNR